MKKKHNWFIKRVVDGEQRLEECPRVPGWTYRWLIHAAKWLGTFENRQPAADYSGAVPVAAVALGGTVTTFAMAYGFSTYSFNFSGDALRHWALVGALAYISVGFQVLREQALQKRTETAEAESKAAQASFAEKQQELIKLLKTMPPSHALSTFTESYRSILFSWRFRPTFTQKGTREEKDQAIKFLEENIRYSLNAAAQLFIHYEHKPLDTKCSAHLAEYLLLDDVLKNPDLYKRVEAGIRFVDDTNDPFHRLKGVLHINPNLSSYAEPHMGKEKVGTPDPKLTSEMFLPVPDCDDEQTDSFRSRALPIAPGALRFGQIIYENVAQQITREASKNWNVTQDVIDQVLEYFDGPEHGRVGSAASYPLLWEVQSDQINGGNSDVKPDIPKLGVITIFTESPADMGPVTGAYWDLVRPMIELQKEMLLAILELRG